MIVQEATSADIPALNIFYDKMCEVLGKQDYLPGGNRGGFPSAEMVQTAVIDHQQFICRQDGKIVAAYIMNNDCDVSYNSAKWTVAAGNDQVAVLHALRVLPEYGGRGYSRILIKHAIDTARNREMKAIRLDCLVGDDIPQRMYRSFGFKYIGTVSINYVDIGMPRNFNLYELEL